MITSARFHWKTINNNIDFTDTSSLCWNTLVKQFCDWLQPFNLSLQSAVVFFTTVVVSTSDPPTATSKRHHGHTHTLEAQRQVVVEATDAPGNPPLRKSRPTWTKRRREAITRTTRPHLHTTSSTALHSEEATSWASMGAPSRSRSRSRTWTWSRSRSWSRSLSLSPSLSPSPSLVLPLLAKRSATPNQTKNPTKTITTVPTATETGTETRNGGNATHRRVPIEEEEDEKAVKKRNAAQTERGSRVQYKSLQSTVGSQPRTRVRGRRRRKEETTVSVFVFVQFVFDGSLWHFFQRCHQ